MKFFLFNGLTKFIVIIAYMNDELERILLAACTPIMVVMVLAEMAYAAYHHLKSYAVKDTANSLLFTSLNFIFDLGLRGASLGIYAFLYSLTPMRWEGGAVYWIALFFAEDLAYYVLHCADHYVRFFWATHVTHHNSEKFNLTVAIRSSVFQPFYRFLFFAPLALVGFQPLHIVFMYAATQVYGFWIHTEFIKKMPAWFEFIMVTPSHHRVHHGSNVKYLDKNMGMVLIIWDRLFGTFAAEDDAEPVRYGVTYKNKLNPVTLLLGEWGKLWHDVRHAQDLATALKYVSRPPGWSPDGTTLTSSQLRQQLPAIREAPPAQISELLLS